MTTAPPPSRPPPPAPTPDPVDGVDLDAFLTGALTARRLIARLTEAAVGGEGVALTAEAADGLTADLER